MDALALLHHAQEAGLRVEAMGPPHLSGSGDCLDRHPLGSMASQAVQGPAWLPESVPHEDSCNALVADAAHQC